MQLIEFKNRIELYNHAYNLIRSLRPQSIGLSGGNTPFPLYQMLKGNINATLFQIDERYTNDTNELNQVKIEGSFDNFISFDTTLALEKCRADYEEKLNNSINGSIDIAILGIGIDGHFASIFRDYQNKTDKVIITTAPENYTTQTRLSVNEHIIMNAKMKLILLVGKDKKDIINQINIKDKKDFPSAIFKQDKNTIILYSND